MTKTLIFKGINSFELIGLALFYWTFMEHVQTLSWKQLFNLLQNVWGDLTDVSFQHKLLFKILRHQWSNNMENSSREEIITHYFHSGLSYTEIISFLFVYHGILITLRQLNRVLRKLGLFRRKFKASITSNISAIQTEQVSSSSSFGYRLMHKKLRQKKLVIDRETVRIAMRYLDTEGVTARSSHRLHRRIYNARGLNYVWHIDGYDKIKPYGFAIHGAIDGYSRKILWFEVLASNNNPKMIGTLYLNYVSQ